MDEVETPAAWTIVGISHAFLRASKLRMKCCYRAKRRRPDAPYRQHSPLIHFVAAIWQRPRGSIAA